MENLQTRRCEIVACLRVSQRGVLPTAGFMQSHGRLPKRTSFQTVLRNYEV